MNTNIYSYLETSGGQSSNLYLNAVHFFNANVNLTSVAAYDSSFPALVSSLFELVNTYFNDLLEQHILDANAGKLPHLLN